MPKRAVRREKRSSMPRYKYSCKPCQLTDIRKFEYEYKQQTQQNLPVCPSCNNVLTKTFVQPPQTWFNNQRQIT